MPNRKEIIDSQYDPEALIKLGDLAVQFSLDNPSKFEQEWFESLGITVANLRDAMESKTRINSLAAELFMLLLHPKEAPIRISQAEWAEIDSGEPTEAEVEAWAWASDLSKTSMWFVLFIVLGILALLSFAVVTFGLESPNNTQIIVGLSFGSGFFAAATCILGAGLYRHYVVRGYLSWEYRGYPDAEVKRSKKFYKMGGWYAYTIGGAFLALSIAFGLVAGRQLPFSLIPDYTNVRLALLALIALGSILFAFGAWPIVRNIVFMAETDKRLGKTKYMASPRLVLTLLPILTGVLSLLLNWLFR